MHFGTWKRKYDLVRRAQFLQLQFIWRQ